MEGIKNSLYHAYVGNDTAPWIVAATRAITGAVLLGAAGFLALWSQTDEVKLLIIAGCTPAIGHLLLRLGVEGTMDARKK